MEKRLSKSDTDTFIRYVVKYFSFILYEFILEKNYFLNIYFL